MKVFSIIAGLASIVSLVLALATYEPSGNLVQALFVVLALLLASVAVTLYRLRTVTIPRLLHLKGACATSHELHRVVAVLSSDEVLGPAAKRVLRQLITDLRDRILTIADAGGELLAAAEILGRLDLDTAEFVEVRRVLEDVYLRVHALDRKRLREAGLEGLVYHKVAENVDQ